MGLLNVYKFQNNMTPLLSNRFKVTFYTYDLKPIGDPEQGGGYYNPSFDVKSVDMPAWKIDSSDSRRRFGNTQYVIPLFDFASSTLKISFIETETMDVTNFLSSLLFPSGQYWMTVIPPIIQIQIDVYDYSYKQKISSKIYACRPKSFSQPEFSQTAKGEPIEIEAEFAVVYELNRLMEKLNEKTEDLTNLVNKDELARREDEAAKELATYNNELTSLNDDLKKRARELEEQRQKAKKEFFDNMKALDQESENLVVKYGAAYDQLLDGIDITVLEAFEWDKARDFYGEKIDTTKTLKNAAKEQYIAYQKRNGRKNVNDFVLEAEFDKLSENDQKLFYLEALGINLYDGIDEEEALGLQKLWADSHINPSDGEEITPEQIASFTEFVKNMHDVDEAGQLFGKNQEARDKVFQAVVASGGSLVAALNSDPKLRAEWEKVAGVKGGKKITETGGSVAGMGAAAYLEMTKDWGYNFGGKLGYDTKTGETLFIDVATNNENDVKRAELNGTTKGIDCNGFVAGLLIADGASGSLLWKGSGLTPYGQSQVIEHDGPVQGGVVGFNTYASTDQMYNDMATPGKQPTLILSENSIIKDVLIKGGSNGGPGHIVAEVEINSELYIVESAGSADKNNGVRRTKKDKWMEKNGSKYRSMKEYGLITRR